MRVSMTHRRLILRTISATHLRWRPAPFEVVKVRNPILSFLPCAPSSCQRMKESCKAYEETADRAVRLLAPVANAISKANSEKLTGMEGNVLFCVLDHAIF
jgi:hypothetical protein